MDVIHHIRENIKEAIEDIIIRCPQCGDKLKRDIRWINLDTLVCIIEPYPCHNNCFKEQE
jgi:hypothetical protein